jgi:hypothetical protein
MPVLATQSVPAADRDNYANGVGASKAAGPLAS